MKKKLLVAALLAASASTQAAWVTTDLGEDNHPVMAGVNGTVIGQRSIGTGMHFIAIRSAPGGMQALPLVDAGFARPVSINGLGHITGYAAKADGKVYGFLYRDDVVTELSLGGDWVQPPLVNHTGLVAGAGRVPDGTDMRAFTHYRGVLNTLPVSGPDLTVDGLNASGQILGSGLPAGDNTHAFIYGNDTVTDLGTLPGYTHSVGTAINNAGQVAGWVGMDTWYPQRAVRYSSGVLTDLGTLGGPTSDALAINGSGHVVGTADTGQEYLFHAFLHDGEKMTDLGTLGGDLSVASSINDAGQIVGFSTTADGGSAEFLYENGRMYDIAGLATGGYTELRHARISESGQITAIGLLNGKWHGLLLTWVQDAPPQATTMKAASLAVDDASRQGKGPAKPRASIAAQRAALCRHASLAGSSRYTPPYCAAKPGK